MSLFKEKNSRSIFFASEKVSQSDESESSNSDKESDTEKDYTYPATNRTHIFRATEKPSSSEDFGDGHSDDEDAESLRSSRSQSPSPPRKVPLISQKPKPQMDKKQPQVPQTRSRDQKRFIGPRTRGPQGAEKKRGPKSSEAKLATLPTTHEPGIKKPPQNESDDRKIQRARLPTGEGSPIRKLTQNVKASYDHNAETASQKAKPKTPSNLGPRNFKSMTQEQKDIGISRKESEKKPLRQKTTTRRPVDSPKVKMSPGKVYVQDLSEESSPTHRNGAKICEDARSPRDQGQLTSLDLTIIGQKIPTPECLNPPTDYSTPNSPVSSLSPVSPLTSENSSRVHFPQIVPRPVPDGDRRPSPKVRKETLKLPHIPAPPMGPRRVHLRAKKARRIKKERNDKDQEAEDTSVLALYKQMKKQMYSIN